MTRTTIRMAAALALGLSGAAAPSGAFEVKTIYALCGPLAQTSASPYCTTYVAGVVDGMKLVPRPGTVSAWQLSKICAPAELEYTELADAVRRFLLEFPESGNAQPSAEHTVALALAGTWPCQANTAPAQ